MPKADLGLPMQSAQQAFSSILNGLSQVVLQCHWGAGICIFIGILYNSFAMAAGVGVGVVSSTGMAVLLKYDRGKINHGIYGFNGALVGLGLINFYELTVAVFLLIIAGASVSTLIMRDMERRGLAPYTFPFVATMWLIMALVSYFPFMSRKAVHVSIASQIDVLSSLGMGFGQIMFQENAISGLLFFMAIALGSKRSAIYALMGVFIGAAFSIIWSLPLNLINLGIYGFNAALCGIVFALSRSEYRFFLAITSMLISIGLMYGMSSVLHLPALTAPFVFSTWMLTKMSAGLEWRSTQFKGHHSGKR